MKHKYMIGGVGIIILLLIVFTVPKYFATAETINGKVVFGEIKKVEIYHFHANRQCYSCKTIGEYAKETVNIHFKEELDSKIIIFDSINIDLPENKELASKYEAKGSSLIIGTYYKDGSFSKEEDTAVWYKIDNKENFVSYLKGVIETKFVEA